MLVLGCRVSPVTLTIPDQLGAGQDVQRPDRHNHFNGNNRFNNRYYVIFLYRNKILRRLYEKTGWNAIKYLIFMMPNQILNMVYAPF